MTRNINIKNNHLFVEHEYGSTYEIYEIPSYRTGYKIYTYKAFVPTDDYGYHVNVTVQVNKNNKVCFETITTED